ncbi:MAG: glutathione S-transferase family protein, partial [Caulobacterales bacterium]|nr:glutathione S-transferase family protein [Caulobacterales bacterium]
MLLCYSALSPFCRKVRMALDHKGLAYEVFDSGDVRTFPAWNERGEVPILVDGDLTVCNSADILGYVDRKHPETPLYPGEPGAYAAARAWERTADTLVDAIITDCGVFAFAEIGEPPAGLIAAGQRDMAGVYDRMERALDGRDFVAGALSAADFALYPHISAARALTLGADAGRHPNVIAWVKRMRATPSGESDIALVRDWWANRGSADVETAKINWGTHRLEW